MNSPIVTIRDKEVAGGHRLKISPFTSDHPLNIPDDISAARYRWIVTASLILAGILLYADALHHPQFLFDGRLFLLNNPLFKDLDYYKKLLDVHAFSTLDEQLGLDSDVTTNFMMRPVAYLTFTINYLISGFHPASFRAVNIALHICNALMVFGCLRKLLVLGSPARACTSSSFRFIPTAAAFVFLLHPMQTESVTYITQRFASLAAFFYLTTIWLYLLWITRSKDGHGGNVFRWCSVTTLLLGMFTRESLFTAPIMIMLLEVVVLATPPRQALKRAWPLLMLLPVIPVMVLLVSAGQSNSSFSMAGALNVVNYEGIPPLHYALTQLAVVLEYVWLYLFPFDQNVDHDHPLYTSLLQPQVMASALTIVGMLAGSYRLFRKYREDVRYALLFAGICWYFLGLSVSSSIIPLPDLMVEHRAYFASAGLICALITLIDLVRSRLTTVVGTRLILAAVFFWCLILSALTASRNDVWASGIDLWSDAAEKSPAKHRPWYNLGVAMVREGRFPEALPVLLKSIELSPQWSQAYEVLSVVYLELKRYQEAVDVSRKGIEVDPSNPTLYNYMGIALAELDQLDDARTAFLTALALAPGHKNAEENLDRLESFLESSIGQRKR